MIRNWLRAAACHGISLLIVCAMVNATFAEEQEKEREPYRYYYVEAAVVSLDANQSLASYRSHGGGSGAPGATLGYSVVGKDIEIVLLVESDHFYADITTRNSDAKESEPAKEQRVDLTSLQPTSIDLGADKQGRTRRLNLSPSVKTVRLTAKPFADAANDLYRLRFHGSRIVLNDKQYIGNMRASDAELFSVEICGVASLEFSLHHLKDAKPWGRLQDGQITFSNPDGTSIEIGNVTNGGDDRVVSGGPYVVWVRWNKPQQTVEEFQTELKAQREQLKTAAVDGAGGTTAEALAIIDRELAREPGPWVTSCGACGVRKADVIRDE
jgi:hypothetical protein